MTTHIYLDVIYHLSRKGIYMYSNGFVVQMNKDHFINGINYQGINNYPWPLINSDSSNLKVKQVQEQIDNAQFSSDAIILLSDVELLKVYVQACKAIDLSYSGSVVKTKI